MSTTSWVGLTFLLLLLAFFIVAYFIPPKNQNQLLILRILAAVCAGFAGLSLTGDIAVNFVQEFTDARKLAVSATGAIALFVLVWVTFPKIASAEPHERSPSFNASFPPGTQFGQAAELIGRVNTSVIQLQGFSDGEKATPLRHLDIQAPSAEDALAALRDLVVEGEIPEYSLLKTKVGYRLISKEPK